MIYLLLYSKHKRLDLTVGCPDSCPAFRYCNDKTNGNCVCETGYESNPNDPDGACCKGN